jgi:hypothetical protein
MELPMAVQLDHVIVPSRDREGSAQLLATILGVPWERTTAVGPFSPVYVNDGLTFDFAQADGPFPLLHYCFRVSESEFDAILARLQAKRIPYRSKPMGAADMTIDTHHGVLERARRPRVGGAHGELRAAGEGVRLTR